MLNYLPSRILKELNKIGLNNICELRLRQNKPVTACINGQNVFLKSTINGQEIEDIVYNACKKSIYSYEEQIKRGFIATDTGVRIGLSGEFVLNNGVVQTIKNFSSLCVRFPREINGFADNFVNNLYDDGSVLVISKSGVGKTTFIRDFARCISLKKLINVVIIDERNEICAQNNGSTFNVGNSADVLTFANKSYGFNQAIRTLNPNLIITDELMNFDDVTGVTTAILSGVDVIATIHAKNVSDALKKQFMSCAKNLFKYYVLLDKDNKNRTVTIYNQRLEKLWAY